MTTFAYRSTFYLFYVATAQGFGLNKKLNTFVFLCQKKESVDWVIAKKSARKDPKKI